MPKIAWIEIFPATLLPRWPLGLFPSHVYWKHPKKLSLLLPVLVLSTKQLRCSALMPKGPFITIIAMATSTHFFHLGKSYILESEASFGVSV